MHVKATKGKHAGKVFKVIKTSPAWNIEHVPATHVDCYEVDDDGKMAWVRLDECEECEPEQGELFG